MKYGIYLTLSFIFFATLCPSAQTISEASVKKMLQGLWGVSVDHSVTIAISGDSLLEYKLGGKEMSLLGCKISKQPCDNEVFKPSPTGLYFSIVSDDDVDLCGALKAIDDKHFWLQLDKNSFIEFEKLL